MDRPATPDLAANPPDSDEVGEDGLPSDRLLFGRILDLAGPDRPPTAVLGLTRDTLAVLIRRHAPERAGLLDGLPDEASGERGEDAIEEADLRDLLLDHRAGRGEEEEWLAAIVARRSLAPNHLWQDMGFANRRELNAMFRRHFPTLIDLNAGDMKWKKFFYRQLCEREGMMLCKSPNCEVCEDVELCFGEEDGDPLNALARMANAPAGKGSA